MVDPNTSNIAFCLTVVGLKNWKTVYLFYEPLIRCTLQERFDLDMLWRPHMAQLGTRPISTKSGVRWLALNAKGKDNPKLKQLANCSRQLQMLEMVLAIGTQLACYFWANIMNPIQRHLFSLCFNSFCFGPCRLVFPLDSCLVRSVWLPYNPSFCYPKKYYYQPQ